MRSIFQTQAVFDQAVHARLSNHVLKNLLVFFHPQPIAKFGQQRVVGQRALQAQIQKIAKGHVETRLLHDALVCEVILILQEFELQQQQRFGGWSPVVGTVARDHIGAEAFEVDDGMHPAQIVILGNRSFEDFMIESVRSKIFGWLWQHDGLPPGQCWSPESL